jgi:ribosomal protein L11 methyltransferase
MDQYTTVSFKGSEEQTGIITALLMGIGFEGIEEQEELTIASIPSSLFNEESVKKIFVDFSLNYSLGKIEQQNWNASWEQSFEPVVIDDFAAVRASFHKPVLGVQHDIIITPKMSFGTGHHATTYMMMQQMQAIDFKNKSVIDFGTGTAVLAILAEKLGAQSILAIDNDEWSINNAGENVEANHCSNIALVLADKMPGHKKADIILANINLNVIAANLDLVKEACFAHTDVLLSGFLSGDEQQMHSILSKHGLRIIKNIYKNNWMAILAKGQ